MIRITINRDGLERGTAEFPIRIEEIGSGLRWEARGRVKLEGDASLVYAPDSPLQDGARLWIEAEDFTVEAKDDYRVFDV